jgi:hypothetical protein
MLTDLCVTSGNSCTENEQCCSGLCSGDRCDIQSSFCTQSNDICSADLECCSGVCNFGTDGTWGQCAEPPAGPANCTGIAGTLCEECNDCCSRLCVPFGDTGITVCQQAQGCRQTGEICQADTECCGGDADSELPGAGNVSCERAEGEDFGVCRNAMSCSPQGNACHLKDYACSVSAAANKCCAADGAEGECVLDDQGVPRCDGLSGACVEGGGSCAFDLDCCTSRCLPDAGGQLRCADAPTCQSAGQSCSSSADCCPTTMCQRLMNAPFGVCTSQGALDCAISGQLCGDDQPACCGEFSCENGRCSG